MSDRLRPSRRMEFGPSGQADGPVLGRWAAQVLEVWVALATARWAWEAASVLRELGE
jgi:hypothetical protein